MARKPVIGDNGSTDHSDTIPKLDNFCGIVMPISAIDGCLEPHWAEVREIIESAIEAAGFTPNLVSESTDVGTIHKRIVQNLFNYPLIVCDVSARNPNVMFELGLRLAFDKPTIIIKDDNTPYSFDTSSIEHLEYPRDLRFTKIVDFKENLRNKIQATYRKATQDPSYSTFLKQFGEFKLPKIDQREVSGQEFIIEELRNIRHSVRRLESQSRSPRVFSSKTLSSNDSKMFSYDFPPLSVEQVERLVEFVEMNESLKVIARNHYYGKNDNSAAEPPKNTKVNSLIIKYEGTDLDEEKSYIFETITNFVSKMVRGE